MAEWYEMTVHAGTYNVGNKRYRSGIHYLSDPEQVKHARMAIAETLEIRLLSPDEVYDLELDGEHADAGDVWEVEQYEDFLADLDSRNDENLGEDFESVVGRLEEMVELGMDAFILLDQERIIEVDDDSQEGPSAVEDWYGYGEEDSGWYDLIIEAAQQEAMKPFNVEEEDDEVTADLEPFNVEEPTEGDEVTNEEEDTKADLEEEPETKPESPKPLKKPRKKAKKKDKK